MFKVESHQVQFELESGSGEVEGLSSCFDFEDLAMNVDSCCLFDDEEEEELLVEPSSSSIPSVQFANFNINSTDSLPMSPIGKRDIALFSSEIEETLANIVEETQQQTLNEATGVWRRLETILEEDPDFKYSSIPQSPIRRPLGTLTGLENSLVGPSKVARKLDFSGARKHWTTRIEDELPIPKVRRTMSDFVFLAAPQPPPPPPMTEAQPVPALPYFASTKDAIPRISPDTVCDLFDGVYTHLYDKLLIIDARYPYEYAGGHLPGAINLCGVDAAEKYLFDPVFNKGQRILVVFHCEFSAERAPRMALFIRNLDRSLNCYPTLTFPMIYILEGGYKAFFQACPQRCDPPGQYLPMRNPRFKVELGFHQRMKQALSRRVKCSLDSSMGLLGLRKSSSAYLGRERASQLTREFYEGRDLRAHVDGEAMMDFPSSDGPEVHQGGNPFGTNLFMT